MTSAYSLCEREHTTFAVRNQPINLVRLQYIVDLKIIKRVLVAEALHWRLLSVSKYYLDGFEQTCIRKKKQQEQEQEKICRTWVQ